MLRKNIKSSGASGLFSALPASKIAAKPQPWHAVSIDSKPLSCAAAHALLENRYLPKEAPALPLSDCTKGARCPCTYRHHKDRRVTPRRYDAFSASTTEKREGPGRRKDDK
jgi:hypothetical protein